MLVSAADAVTSPQPALAAPSAPAQRATVLERPDEASALVTARMNHGPVKITGLTTETSEFFAQPDGTVEATVHAAPVRVRSGNQWVPVDLKLRANADGTVSSVAHPEGLTISGARTGTAGALATVGHGAEQISMGWTGKLPEPVLEGARATYRDVLPGIDLAVEATRTGFEQFVVVKTREAATRVGELSLPLTGASVSSYTRDASGALVLKNKKGRTLATSPTPMMWDAQVGADGVTPKRQTVVTSAATRRTAKSASAGRNASAPGVDVRLTPDRAWINDPATQFPVTIDPQVAVGTVFDTYVTDGDTGDRGGVNNLQIGLLSGAGGKRTRSFVSWDTTALRGKQITAATASFYNYYSTTCAANSWEIWSTNAFNDATRWANQPAWLTKEASATGTRGFDSSCGDAYVAISATSFFQRAATANQTRGYMGIRATSETATSAFKQFRSRNAAESNQVPKATVTYNSYPVIGTRSTVPATACATGTARPFIASKTPQLKAKLTDPEGTAMTASFEWSTTAGAGVTTATTAKAASGSTFSTTIPANALAENGSYRWRVRGYDSTGYSPWSAYCEFTVDTTAPALPAVASTDYPAGQWSGGAGSPGKFTLSASGATDVASYQYGLDVNPPDQTVNAASLGAAATVTITPATAGAHTLYVRSRDRAGNLSPVKTYSFSAGGAAITAPKDGDLSAGFVAIEGSGNSTSTGVTYQWRRGDLDTWTTIPTGDVTTAAGQQAVTWPLSVPAGGSAPKLNWNLAQTVNAAEAGPDPLDGPVQLRGLFTGGAGATSNPVKLTLDRNRAWAATEDVGVGSVNLITGNLAIEERDSATGASLGRTANSRLAREVDPMFGPGWSSSVSVTGDDSGYTTLSVTGSLVQIALDDGATMGFTKKTATTFTPQVGLENLKLAYTATGDTYTLTDEAGLAVTFGRPGTQPAGQYVPTSAAAKGTTDKISYSWETVTVAGAAITRPTLAINPPPAGITCTAASLVKGCRATKFSYATASTASGTAPNQWGDYAGRIKELTFTAWDPDASPAQMKTVVLKRYAYDNTGRLRSAWDPRLDRTESGVVRHLETTYAYDADGLVSEVRPAGQEPWNLIYSVIPGDSGKGRLVQVARGIGTAIARTTVVYAVPLTGAGAPYDLSAAQTARWAQPEAPVLATALFPATQVPDGNQATGALPSSYERASISYLDANGRTVNGAEPGGYISSQSYDKWGNQIRSLDAANRQQALEDSTTDTADQEAGLAGSLSELNVFSGDGSRLTSAFEPEREVSLPDGSSVRGRPYTEYSYDEGAPATDEPFNVVTTETRMVRVWGSDGATYDADKRTTKTTYDWTLLEPLTETVDPGGLNLVTRYQYDPVSKRKISETAPGGSAAGDTPSTQRILYYRVGTGSGNAACDNRPEFNDLICRVEPGGQAESGPAVPVKVVTYDMFGQVRKTEESTSAGVQRTTTATYDAANRPQQQSITAAAGLGEAVPVTRTVYDPATGLLTRLQSVDANGAVTAEIVYGYDTLGRARSYKDADGITSTFDYDLLDRPTTTTDGLGTRTYAYDGGTERRGLPTSVADSQAGTYTAAYDANGGVISQQWPNGVVVQAEANEAGDAVGITYTQAGCAADDCTLFSESLTASVHSQVSNRTSSLSQQDFSYDSAGRLAKVQDTVDSNCVTRVFGYDAGTNRTSTTSYDATEDGSCQTGTVAGQVTRGYDKADRLTTAGYEYDALGRTRIVPAVDSPIPGGGQSEVSYYASNLTRKIVQDDRSSVYQLDVTGNRYRSRAETRGAATTTKVNHYSADGDSPSWTDEGNTTTTRTIVGIAGTTGTHSSTAGLTSFITNLHGDVVAGMAGSSQGLAYTSDYTEDGQPRTPGAETHRYGWLGSEQRASDTPNGLTLMGVRLYNPTTSRFLSVDPVRGGNANDYDYCSGDSVNCSDVSGAFSCKWQKKSVSLNWRGWKYDLKRKCWITNAETRFLMMYGGFSAAMYGVFAGFTAPLIATGAGILVPLALAAMGAIIGAIVWFADKIYEDRCGKRKGFYVNARIYKNRGWSRRPHWSAGMGCNK